MEDQGTNRESGGVRYRKLRIAWSVGWGVAGLVFVAIWLRTVDNGDNFQEPLLEAGDFAVYSTDGIIWGVNAPFFAYSPPTNDLVSYYIPSRYQSTPDGFASTAIHKSRGFDTQFWSRNTWFVQTPNWFPVLVSVALGGVPWLRWRFSLRTLLIAMTLVAVVLGVIVYAVR
jgi:hypothetical protein